MQSNVVMPVEDQTLGEALKLRKKHDREYYGRLDKLLERIEHIEELLLSQTDPMGIDYLTKSYDRLLEKYRIISGKSLPPVIKAPEPKKIASVPVLPLD
jgi:hypothetical protein